MKRVISIFLSLALLLALCACGGKETHVEEKKEQVIYQVVEAPPIQTLEPIEQPAEDYLKILDVKLKPYKDNQYWLNVKFQCLYPKGKHPKYPDTIDLFYSLLDHEGVIIRKETQQFSNVDYDDIAWSCAFDAQKAIGLLIDINEIDAVKFSGYRFWSASLEEYDFQEPLVFRISDLEIEQ